MDDPRAEARRRANERYRERMKHNPQYRERQRELSANALRKAREARHEVAQAFVLFSRLPPPNRGQ